MGGKGSKLSGASVPSLGSKTKAHVLVVGLDASGKSTIIEQLKPTRVEASEIAPTVGFHVDEFSKAGVNFTVFDMSGAGRYRNLWEQYYKDAQAVIYVIDSADKIRMCVAKDELDMLLAHKDIRKVPLLFFANKMDIPTALVPADISIALRLEDVKDRPINIVASNALTGEGLESGIQWLAERIKRQ